MIRINEALPGVSVRRLTIGQRGIICHRAKATSHEKAHLRTRWERTLDRGKNPKKVLLRTPGGAGRAVRALSRFWRSVAPWGRLVGVRAARPAHRGCAPPAVSASCSHRPAAGHQWPAPVHVTGSGVLRLRDGRSRAVANRRPGLHRSARGGRPGLERSLPHDREKTKKGRPLSRPPFVSRIPAWIRSAGCSGRKARGPTGCTRTSRTRCRRMQLRTPDPCWRGC